MPVTFRPASHAANPVSADDVETLSSSDLLSWSCSSEWSGCEEVLQSFLGSGGEAAAHSLLPAPQGLVQAITEAYRRHRALVLRPDDVWLAILVQFNFYVNAHAEDLRSKFVAHEGKKELVVQMVGTRYSVNFGAMAAQMTREMDKFIVDSEVRGWILPKFSTTTTNDTVVAAVVMMATFQAYFRYASSLTCGIPQVTLEGEKADWEEILRRAEKLTEYGEEPSAWYELLKPVLTRFVRAFDDPTSAENIEFWQKVAHFKKNGSGPTRLSGWVTAFCAFGPKGNWLGRRIQSNAGTLQEPPVYPEGQYGTYQLGSALILDNVLYHVLSTKSIPTGHAAVDVKINDNGQLFEGRMVAGFAGIWVSDSGDVQLSENGERDVTAPAPGWWIFTKRKGESQ
ncbi:hypothetical protein BDW22DRAFT_1347797 [Trametopsis cervina]|nr:hypothetical protein BDW22DRAFT_1347797 [Trametopsis cervina]